MTTVILGAGIIGLSTAFYLSESIDPSTIHLVEVTPTLFSSASGYAGGFLAEDWFSAAAAELGALSFAEHKRLAEQYNGAERWGYSKSTGTTYTAGSSVTITNAAGGKDAVKQDAPDVWCRVGGSRVEVAPRTDDDLGMALNGLRTIDPTWLSRSNGDKVDIISEEGSTAQLDPRRLCQFLLYKCQSRGVHLHHPYKATAIGSDSNDVLSHIDLINLQTKKQEQLSCNRLLIAAGAWSPQVFRTLFPSSRLKLPITSLAGHSLVLNSPRWQRGHEEHGCHAIFTTDEQGYSPEIFSRIGGEIYLAGVNSTSIPLPLTAQEARVDDDALRMLRDTAKRLLGMEGSEDLVEVRKGLCFRPVTSKGTPILDRISDKKLGGVRTNGGVFLAAGHGPWGISMSLGTGKIMSEMMTGTGLSVDVSGLRL